jgi:hypothetical protein
MAKKSIGNGQVVPSLQTAALATTFAEIPFVCGGEHNLARGMRHLVACLRLNKKEAD